jgi:hypothetical protein
VREPSLGVPERNGKVHRLALRRETGFDKPIRESRRADSNRLPLLQLRVIHQALQGFARGCKSCILKRLSSLRVAACCTVLRSRWYQSGIKDALFLVVCGNLGATQSTFLHLAQIVHRHADPITAPQPAESVIQE